MAKRMIDSSEYDKIVNLYNSGISTVKIGEMYNCCHKTIAKILDDYGISRSTSRYRTYELDTNYFDKIDTQDKAYILGFLYADGNVGLKKGTVTLSLQESDSEILNKINKCICSNAPLHIIDQSNHRQPNENTDYHYSNMASLKIYSKHICHKLIEYGVYENKSLILEFPQWINQDLYNHFIRGYFDGDGSFCTRVADGYGRRDLITITSTDSFCRSIKSIISDTLNIPSGNIYDASCHNGITKVLSISGANQTKLILDWIYKDANLYLERKHNLYLDRFYS